MQKKIFSPILCVLITLSTYGQNIADSSKGILNLRFVDDETGMPVIPGRVELRRQDNIQQHFIIPKDSTKQDGTVLFKPNGTLKLKLPVALYKVVVYTKGYKPMGGDIYVTKNSDEGKNTFDLVPLVHAKESTTEYLKSKSQKYNMLVFGFITDDSTGKPLENVLIYSSDKVAQGRTDKRGYYEFYLPLPENESEVEDRGTIYYEKEGYITEVRGTFDMWSYGATPSVSRMTPGSGAHRVDIHKESDRRKVIRMTIEKEKEEEESSKKGQQQMQELQK